MLTRGDLGWFKSEWSFAIKDGARADLVDVIFEIFLFLGGLVWLLSELESWIVVIPALICTVASVALFCRFTLKRPLKRRRPGGY